LAVLLLQLITFAPLTLADNAVGAPGETRKLLVTAYYSPLPNQEFYMRGTYEGDIRLNGRGTNGADGTEVYIGMLAAPRTYPFGTRVMIPGLGVGEVHDRGGAILAKKDYDRIDVWMGHGEEGLARALNWGARLVEGEVFFKPDQVEPGLNYGWVSTKLPAATEAKLRARTNGSQVAQTTPSAAVAQPQSVPEVTKEPIEEPEDNDAVRRLRDQLAKLQVGLGKDDAGDDVVHLQRMLWELQYYNDELSRRYDQGTMDAVYAFQRDHGVVSSEWELGAGYYGKKTHATMQQVVEGRMTILADYPKEAQVWVPAKRNLPEIASLEVPHYEEERQALFFSDDLLNKKSVQLPSLSTELDYQDQNDEVVLLQDLLIAHGYLAAGLNTGYFGPKTQEAVLELQIEQGVVSSTIDPGAGRVGPKTLKALNSL